MDWTCCQASLLICTRRPSRRSSGCRSMPCGCRISSMPRCKEKTGCNSSELPRRSCHPFIPTSLHCGKRTRKHTETGGDTCVRQAEPGRYMLMGDLRSRSPLGRIGESCRGIPSACAPGHRSLGTGRRTPCSPPGSDRGRRHPHTHYGHIHTSYDIPYLYEAGSKSIYHSQELDSTTIDRLEARWPMDSKSGARCSLTSKNIE